MCGLFGALLRNHNEKQVTERAQASLQALTHRGPDGNAIYTSSNIVLGHTRLSFLDLSEHANQPFSDITGRYKLVYNGEIYNFSQLRDELRGKGFSFRTGSDTEVLLYGLIAYGESFLPRLEGMFAFLFIDLEKGEAIAARDRFGIKPLFYAENDQGVFFASEIKALHPWVTIQPDDLTIAAYLAGHYLQTSGNSFAKNIKFFPTGSYARFRINEPIHIRPFFEIVDFYNKDYAEELSGRSVSTLINDCDRILSESVRKHMISDVPVGALCSGGIDSSLILAMAKGENSNLRIFHANVVGPHSELDAAKRLATHLNLELDVADCQDKDFIDLLPDVIYHQEFPFIYHPNSAPFLMVSRLVKSNQVKAVLTGEGADEALLGYADIPLSGLISGYYGLTNKLRKLFHRIPWLGETLWRNPAHKNNGIDLLNGYDSAIPTEWLEKIRTHGISENEAQETLPLLSYHLRTLLMRNDRLGMAASIEARFPFLDHDFIRFCVNLPRSLKVHFSTSAAREIRHPFFATKWILRQVADRYLPSDLAQRRKRGFPTNAFDRIRIDPNYFNDSWVQSYLRLDSNQTRLLRDSLTQEEKLRLLMLNVWGLTFVEQVPKSLVTEQIHKSVHFS